MNITGSAGLLSIQRAQTSAHEEKNCHKIN